MNRKRELHFTKSDALVLEVRKSNRYFRINVVDRMDRLLLDQLTDRNGPRKKPGISSDRSKRKELRYNKPRLSLGKNKLIVLAHLYHFSEIRIGAGVNDPGFLSDYKISTKLETECNTPAVTLKRDGLVEIQGDNLILTRTGKLLCEFLSENYWFDRVISELRTGEKRPGSKCEIRHDMPREFSINLDFLSLTLSLYEHGKQSKKEAKILSGIPKDRFDYVSRRLESYGFLNTDRYSMELTDRGKEFCTVFLFNHWPDLGSVS